MPKYTLLLFVTYESAGGMGENDAIWEGLKAIIENPDNPTVFTVLDLIDMEPLISAIRRRMGV